MALQAFYRRDLKLEALDLADGSFGLRTKMVDAEHQLTFTGHVDVSGRLADVGLEATRMPFVECKRSETLAQMLAGHPVGRPLGPGFLEALGGGCFHVLEVVEPTLRFAANIRAGLKAGWSNMHPPSASTGPAMQRARLDSCLAFHDGRPQLERAWRQPPVGWPPSGDGGRAADS